MPRRRDEAGFSRRSFLKTVGAGGVAAGVLAKAPGVKAQQTFNPVGPGPVPITLNINGQAHRLQIEPRVTLLDALRMRVRPDRQQARLRSRHLRRLHDARRRPHGLRLFDAGDRGAGQADSHRRRPRQRRDSSIPCSRRSATRTR